MPRYLIKIKDKTVDYAKIPKGMKLKKLKKMMHPRFKKGYTLVEAATYKSAIKKLLK